MSGRVARAQPHGEPRLTYNTLPLDGDRSWGAFGSRSRDSNSSCLRPAGLSGGWRIANGRGRWSVVVRAIGLVGSAVRDADRALELDVAGALFQGEDPLECDKP
jgi:hypothetical protein